MEKLMNSISTFSDISDEPEDGEILDEEENGFEAISDQSIHSESGKSVYSPSLFSAISLSSISDLEGTVEELHRSKQRKSAKHYLSVRKRRKREEVNYKRRKRHRLTCTKTCSSSDTDLEQMNFDKDVLRQLHDAIHINDSNTTRRKSLRSRLKLTKTPSDSTDENDGDSNISKATVPDEIDDKHLAEMRSQLLKEVVLKKHMERKRRKEEISSNSNDGNNKENNNTNVTTKEEDKEEEDLDVMRANLLASMSNKITSSNSNATVIPQEPNHNIQQTSNNINTVTPPPVVVKPLIINLNEDTDDSENNEEPPPPRVPTPVDQSVTMFLKAQREQFEAKHKYMKEVESTLTAPAAPMLPPLKETNIEHLPKIKQKEYYRLKQELLKRNLMLKKGIPPKRNVVIKNTTVNNGNDTLRIQLKKTVEDLQESKDGRLQMKGKYKELAPFIQKINQISDQKKVLEKSLAKLMSLLEDTKKQLHSSNQAFTDLARQLIQQKKMIDMRVVTNKSSSTTVSVSSKKTEVPEKIMVASENVMENEKQQPQQPDTKEEVVKYISPLDNRSNSNAITDPLQQFCPFDLFGQCKDPECTYKHCS